VAVCLKGCRATLFELQELRRPREVLDEVRCLELSLQLCLAATGRDRLLRVGLGVDNRRAHATVVLARETVYTTQSGADSNGATTLPDGMAKWF
jgi:hypothetical protein